MPKPPAAEVEAGGRAVRVTGVPRRRVHRIAGEPRAAVGIHVAALGDAGETLPALARQCDGIVVAGLGVGHVSEGLAAALVEAARSLPVVLASRTGAGPVLTGTYGFEGSESYLLSHGLLSAGLLDPYKARVLLTVALDAGYDEEGIRDAFADASGLG